MEFSLLLAMLALIKKVTDFLKLVTNRDVNGITTQVTVWIGGVLVVFLCAQTDFASGLNVGEISLSELNFASLILLGLTVGSGASVAHDYLQARDNTNASAVSHLRLMPEAPVIVGETAPVSPAEPLVVQKASRKSQSKVTKS